METMHEKTTEELMHQARVEEREHTLETLRNLAQRTNSPNIYLAVQVVEHSKLSGE